MTDQQKQQKNWWIPSYSGTTDEQYAKLDLPPSFEPLRILLSILDITAATVLLKSMAVAPFSNIAFTAPSDTISEWKLNFIAGTTKGRLLPDLALFSAYLAAASCSSLLEVRPTCLFFPPLPLSILRSSFSWSPACVRLLF